MLKPLHIGACALLTAIAVGCTQHYKPDVSTETGNPPVIDLDKVALVITSDEVHVTGEPGAVTPPEGEIEVTTVRTEDVVRGPIDDDGSFDVMVDATLDDVFEVRAVNGEARSAAVIVVRGGAEVIEGDGGGLTCEQQTSLGSAILQSALDAADQSCTTSADCMQYWRSASCISSCFGGYYSEAGLQSIQDAVASIDDGVCASFEDDGCQTFAPPCVGPLPAACVDGQCVEDETPNETCDTCNMSTISWRISSPGTLPALPSTDVFTLSGCNGLTLTNDGGKCTTTVPQCSDDAETASIESVLAAMQNRYVAAAFGAGETVGESEELAGYHYELTLNDETFTYRSCGPTSSAECGQNDPIATLVQELDRIGQQNHCDVQPDCDSPYQNGLCDGNFIVWWHNPETGACEERGYGGCDGNANRYDSLEACEAVCVTHHDPNGECPTNRMAVQECLMCGLGGGCVEEGEFCAKFCTNDADCADEEGPLGFGSECDEASGTCRSLGGCI